MNFTTTPPPLVEPSRLFTMPSIVWGKPPQSKKKYVPDFVGRLKKTGQKPLSEAQINSILEDNRG